MGSERRHLPCPACGKKPKAGQTHYIEDHRGGKCFVCGYFVSLDRLREADGMAITRPAPVTRPTPPRRWQRDPDAVQQALTRSPRLVAAWQQYKPVSLESIARYGLGLGRVPSAPCDHVRLTYPVGPIGCTPIGFRGRNLDCGCAKWLTAGGSTTWLMGLDLVEAGDTVVICENWIDAIALMERQPVRAVAGTAGVTTWRDEWTAGLVAARPARVVVWFDHDLPGQIAHEAVRRRALRLWQAQHGDAAPPPSYGVRVANRLLDAGLPVTLYRWPAAAPLKADIGWVLSQTNDKETTCHAP